MKIKEKLFLEKEGLLEHGPINIVILGDSVSHASFLDYNNYEAVYWSVLKNKLHAIRNYVPINTICAAVGGTTAKDALPRLERDVLCHRPDLVIVCFGLNDVNGALEEYLSSLEEIFSRCKETGADVIFLSPNMLNLSVVSDTPKRWYDYAHVTAEMQKSGKMDTYIYSAMDLARKMGIAVCDAYSEWKKLAEKEDITFRLSNRINHPTEEMHGLFADLLFGELMGEGEIEKKENASTMYKGEKI
jgi:hypothetical protein